MISTFAKAQQNIQIGDIYTFEDNTQGVVFYVDEEWYLPTASEFYKLLLGNVNGKVNKTLKANKCKPIMGWYWTSSEYDNGQAWTMNGSGRFKKCSKLAYRNISRAIRKF